MTRKIELNNRWRKCFKFLQKVGELGTKLEQVSYDAQISKHKYHKDILDFYEKRILFIESIMLSVDVNDKTESQDRADLDNIMRNLT